MVKEWAEDDFLRVHNTWEPLLGDTPILAVTSVAPLSNLSCSALHDIREYPNEKSSTNWNFEDWSEKYRYLRFISYRWHHIVALQSLENTWEFPISQKVFLLIFKSKALGQAEGVRDDRQEKRKRRVGIAMTVVHCRESAILSIRHRCWEQESKWYYYIQKLDTN